MRRSPGVFATGVIAATSTTFGTSLTGVSGASSSAPCMSLRLTIQDSEAPSRMRRSKRGSVQPLTASPAARASRLKADSRLCAL